MPGRYNRRRSTRSRRTAKRRSTKSIAWKKPTAQNQKVQIFSLQKQVNTLHKKTSNVFQWTKFDYPFLQQDLLPPIARTTEDTEAFNVYSLTQPNNWEEIFSTGETVIQQKAAWITNLRIEGYFTPKNSTTPLTQKWINVWLVTLRRESAAQVLNQTNNLVTTANDNGLNAQKQGEFYYTRNSSGPFSSMPLLNPRVFKIHQHRRFSIGNITQEEMQDPGEDVPVVDWNLMTQRIKMNARMNMKLATQTGIHGVAETWKDMNQYQVPQTSRIFLITHVGGYANDGDNGVNFAPHITFTVKTVR